MNFTYLLRAVKTEMILTNQMFCIPGQGELGVPDLFRVSELEAACYVRDRDQLVRK